MGFGLTTYSRQLLVNPESFKAALDAPFVIWETSTGPLDEVVLLGTTAGGIAHKPTNNEPVCYEIKKGRGKPNAFAMGVTVGRTDNNDIVLEDNSVSRFHAYFQKDAKTKAWKVVDAESKNGTFVGPLKLKANEPALVPDKARIKFGSVEVLFLEPKSFIEYLQAQVK